MRRIPSVASALFSFSDGRWYSFRHFCVSESSGKIRLTLCLFFILLCNAHSQSPELQEPEYNWVHSKKMDSVVVARMNSEDLIISVATDIAGNIYTLSYGNGVHKRDPEGNIIKKDFISANHLDSPLDFVIDTDGFFYVADFKEEEDGNWRRNGKIRIFDPQGNPLSTRTIYTEFYRPTGLDILENKLYVAEFHDGLSGPEQDEEFSRVRIYNSTTGAMIQDTEQVNRPYRIAVNSQGRVYVSQAGDEDPAVVIFNEILEPEGELDDILSPGSIVIDPFDFVHVIEYNNRVDFSKFISLAELNFFELLEISGQIYEGQINNEFKIKIFDPSGIYLKDIVDKLDFPVDLAFDNCRKMFVNNSEVFRSFLPEKLVFDLEIYERTPSFDTEAPQAKCIGSGAEFSLTNGVVTILPAQIDDGSSDNCGILSLSISPNRFTSAGEYMVTLLAIDAAGNKDECTAKIIVTSPQEELTITCPEDQTAVKDLECKYTVQDFRSLGIPSDPAAIISQSPQPGEVTVGDTEITLTAEVEGETAECTFLVILKDKSVPVFNCPSDVTDTFNKEEGYILPDYRTSNPVSDNCDANSTYTQTPPPGNHIFDEVTSVTLIAEDESGNIISCIFTLKLTHVPGLQIISCPNPKKDFLDESCNFIIPDFSDLIEVNKSDAQISQSPAEGEIISGSGIRNIELTATWEGEIVKCNFDLSLLDATKPEVYCVSALRVILDENGSASITAEQLDQGSTDNCGAVNMSLSRNDFTAEDISSSPVSIVLTVTDEAGNFETCTTQVTVEPNDPFSCISSHTLFLDSNGEAKLDIEKLYHGSLGPDGIVSLNRDSFSCTDVGVQTVLLNYSGYSTGSCEIIVTVVDNIAPEPRAKNIEISLDENGTATITASDLDNGSTDNCMTDLEYQISKSSFTCEDLGENPVEFRIIDASGNDGSLQVKVIVRDPLNVCEEEPLEPPLEDEFLILFPNPGRGEVQFFTSEGILLHRVDIFDMRGRLLDSRGLEQNPFTQMYFLDLQMYQTGIYTLKLFSEEREYIRRAIIATQ